MSSMDQERLRQIEELYHSTRERQPSDREAYLAEACGDDHALRRAVAALLAPESSGGPMEQPAWQAAAVLLGTLEPGSQVGPYEILSPIGQGGMGEVYKAQDRRLGRMVAIKTVNEAFSGRFLREARAISALNHPNICTLHDVGPNYLVMELVEGDNLKGPLPLATVLDYARQIAGALEAAHEKGIVHRDLKPGNIKIKPDGTIKVLDFGLAKISPAVSAMQDPQSSPTLTLDATRAGMILGTAAYMSPEQARGEPVDQRADIWAFGVVLYEMLAGERMFEARTASETLAAVLLKEPDLDRVPPQIRPVLRRCLAKDPKQRLHHIADARLMLDEPAETAPAPAARVANARWYRMGMAVLGLALAALLWVHFREKRPAPEAVRFQIFPPENRTFAGTDALLSPDGRRLAFQSPAPDGRAQLWIRSLDSLESKPLPGAEGLAGTSAFWSPDSRFLGFAVQNKLMRVDVSGGLPQTVCDIQGQFRGAAWSSRGVILFGIQGSGLWRVSETGGAPTQLTKIDTSRQEAFHAAPYFLPDGLHFLYYRGPAENSGIYLGSLEPESERPAERLLSNASTAVYAPSPDPESDIGYVLFSRDGSLMAQPLDARRLQLAGDAVKVAERVGGGTGPRPFSASATGALAFRTGTEATPGATSQLTWVDRSGTTLRTIEEPGSFDSVALSPDGTRVALSWAGPGAFGPHDLWLYELARGTRARLTTGPDQEWLATWSPNGSRIVYASNGEGGIYNLYWTAADGAGKAELLFQSNQHKSPQDWSSDGRFLLFSVNATGLPTRNEASHDLWVLPLNSANPADRKPVPYLATGFNESQGRFSPDGRYVAYRSDASGKDEIYVQPFPAASGGKWTVSQAGGFAPRWRHDGKELFFIAPDSRMMSVQVTTDPIFQAGIPKALFQTSILATTGIHRNVIRYDVSHDGKKFLINRLVSEPRDPGPAFVTVLLNWRH